MATVLTSVPVIAQREISGVNEELEDFVGLTSRDLQGPKGSQKGKGHFERKRQ